MTFESFVFILEDFSLRHETAKMATDVPYNLGNETFNTQGEMKQVVDFYMIKINRIFEKSSYELKRLSNS